MSRFKNPGQKRGTFTVTCLLQKGQLGAVHVRLAAVQSLIDSLNKRNNN